MSARGGIYTGPGGQKLHGDGRSVGSPRYDKRRTYEEYLAYLETLEGIARLPYTAVVENPPDLLAEYRRPFTREEYERRSGQEEGPGKGPAMAR